MKGPTTISEHNVIWGIFLLMLFFLFATSHSVGEPLIPPHMQFRKTPDVPRPSLPPAQFAKPYDGALTITIVSSTDEVGQFCDIGKTFLLGCARRNAFSCAIMLVKDELARAYGWNTGLMLRHEIAHCNGWPGNHLPVATLLPASTPLI